MNIKKYCLDRKLEMISESQSLGKKQKLLIVQGQQLQAQLNEVNQLLAKLDIELDIISQLESRTNGHKEELC